MIINEIIKFQIYIFKNIKKMHSHLFKYIFILFIFKIIKSGVVQECQIGNYCFSEKYGCSVYGNCNFNIFEYFKENNTEEDRLPHCQCNMGYSSYDITDLKTDNNILCCYEQKGQMTAFLLEMLIGFGVGHFYIGNYLFGIIKLIVQIFLCVLFWCVTYFACNREHSFQTNPNEINNNENLAKTIFNQNKNDNNDKNIKEIIDENENENDNDSNENKDNDSKNDSFELEENKESEIMYKNFIKCPKSMFVIYFSGIGFFVFHIVDIILIGFGVFKDGNGEELYMW